MLKNKKGITLVALVVTIVVLLILAGVSINLVLGNNGIIAKAKEAETKSAEASQNDLKGMNALTEEMNNALGEKPKVDLSKYKIGDYVNYTYDTAENYKIPFETWGDTNFLSDGIPQTTGLKWRILNIDEANGTVDLISENPTGTSVWFSDILGYNDGPYLMNEICKAQYSNKSLGVNVAETEVETKMEKIDITKGNDPYEESKAIATTEPTNDNRSGTGKPLTVTQTYYSIPINEPNYGDAGSVLSNSTWYWVASRYVNTSSDRAYFGLRYVDTTTTAKHVLFSSYGDRYNTCSCLRPVVSLSSSLLTGEKTNNAWNLSK